MTPQTKIRDDLVGYVQRHLVGPEREDELLDESPCKVYSAAVLFPRLERSTDMDVEVDEEPTTDEAPADPPSLLADEEGAAEDDDELAAQAGPDVAERDDNDDVVLLANTYYPAAMGLTFLVDATATADLVVHVIGATYVPRTEPQEKGRPRTQWARVVLAVAPQRFSGAGLPRRADDRTISDNLGLRVIWRPEKDGCRLVTVSLFNRHQARSPNKPPSAKQCFFQTGFSVRSSDGSAVFKPYDISSNRARDPEEASLALLYRNRRQYAGGHGCAPDWGGLTDGAAAEIRTETLPRAIVPPIEPTSIGGKALEMYHLGGLDGEDEENIPDTLTALASSYGSWIDDREAEIARLPPQLVSTARRHVAECRLALARIANGIALLRQNGLVLRAFMLANRAVLKQQFHSKLPNREVGDAWPVMPGDYRTDGSRGGRWRSFQLAFILMNLPAFMEAAPTFESDRRIVDLIWFPTGGGKTEAYLGLTAYAIFLRRLLRPSNGGCTVLMRYTLRLLTSQQFQRAAALICACELLRKENEQGLGREPITLGLWVGGAASPNTRKEAQLSYRRLAKARQDEERKRDNLFQVLACPWCGTRLDRPEHLGYIAEGGTVAFRCPDSRCAFALPSKLPISVIDEDLYATPPTLLIGTVDKFAMLTWRQEAGSLFGIGRPQVDPPDLIIQDELHLISGPLGSMVGLYEAAIEFLCTKTRAPKIVASTATIRSAQEQCKALYDRESFQFPPPGIDVADSFFAKEDAESPGRLYFGVLASAAPSPITALVRTAAALHQGIRSVPLPGGAQERDRDPFWTQLQYFGSLRELGRAATLVEQDIPEHLKVIKRRLGLSLLDVRPIRSPVELTSRLTAEQVPEILEDLKIPYLAANEGSAEQRPKKRPIDVLLATNMISVGVDVPRLGLMVVVGQPKSTSEYIQASSRVGRSGPGLVVALYNAGKPRDRSHYEQFRAYHEAFYRHVEPTSVTPFSIPVLERALHAVLVIVVRHICGISRPDRLRHDDPKLARFIAYLKARSRRIDPEHADEVIARLNSRLDHWARFLPPIYGTFAKFESGNRLLVPAATPTGDSDDGAWRTPTSMRNVDAECAVEILRVPYVPGSTP